ncbi:hypothetical protein RO3G_03808 [Rhizopus delemar RA 99-880]|uniref:Uncharacterized protein n=1 Tax=Rhizopus delemar (strain RA 99-880 / ATCC MYA-4621 / FGSC 9543 / NRRL 43880) TaxID=246409 RepID=I1BSC3_RHIO9|nr:hypothetical protein RO3G_03808 [Rhizopus delemar RA 99-880]|eukprot:EIE79103.1 hypothetical protein RO3G_03808 [Rhizopus delemar RA 99-880]
MSRSLKGASVFLISISGCKGSSLSIGLGESNMCCGVSSRRSLDISFCCICLAIFSISKVISRAPSGLDKYSPISPYPMLPGPPNSSSHTRSQFSIAVRRFL